MYHYRHAINQVLEKEKNKCEHLGTPYHGRTFETANMHDVMEACKQLNAGPDMESFYRGYVNWLYYEGTGVTESNLKMSLLVAYENLSYGIEQLIAMPAIKMIWYMAMNSEIKAAGYTYEELRKYNADEGKHLC
jgi:hypothetical protein